MRMISFTLRPFHRQYSMDKKLGGSHSREVRGLSFDLDKGYSEVFRGFSQVV